jgi:hypothetical protein
VSPRTDLLDGGASAGHRHFEPDDPVQAADIIRTADLLMRMLYDISGQARSSSA